MNEVVVLVLQEGGKLLSSYLHNWAKRPIRSDSREEDERSKSVSSTAVMVESRPGIALPNREETTYELKRRLAKELYKAELDLANGLMIAGKPCDCLSNKHTLELDACTEELVSQDPDNNVYQEIQQWIPANQHKLTPEAILSGQYKMDYPHMALQFKEFRKRVLGSDARSSITPPPAPAPVSTVTVIKAEKPAEKETPQPTEQTCSEKEIELTLDQAQELAAEQAREEVKKRWNALS